MRLGNYLRIFAALIVSISWSCLASAEEYTWGNANYSTIPRQDSPQAWCALYKDFRQNQRGTSGVVNVTTRIKSATSANCDATWTATGGSAVYDSSPAISRTGDSCPSGAEYNTATGQCESTNQCADKQGLTMNWSKSGTAGDGYGTLVDIKGKPMFIPGRDACFSGCAIETTDRRCTARVNGNYFCRGSGEYTGAECPTGAPTGPDLVSEDTVETPEPQNFKDEQPCSYSADGSKQVCTSSKTEEVEGQICATREDGSEFCTTKLPEKNGIDIRTEVTKEVLADGSVKTTKKDTATVTKCVGVNNCTTTTAETTKTTTEDANGNKTGESSTCKGEACPGKGNPDGDGDGVGDCSSGDCGGAVEGQDWYTPTGDTFGSVLTEFVAKVQQTPIASRTTSFLTFRASGSCPRWSVSVWVFDIDIDQLCSGDIPWAAIKAVILAAAGFFAFRIALL